MNNQQAFAALKNRVSSVSKEGADAWGNSSSRNGWLPIVIPNKDVIEAINAAAALNIKLYNTICSDIYGFHS